MEMIAAIDLRAGHAFKYQYQALKSLGYEIFIYF